MPDFDPYRILEFVVVLGAAIGAIHQWVVKPIVAAVHRQAEESRKLSSVVEDVVEIRTQLHRNGGTSLRDAVIRIEDGMNELKGRMDAHLDLHLQQQRQSD